MIFQIPVGDLFAGGPPYALESFRVLQKLPKCAHAEGLAGSMGMQTDIHGSSALGTFAVKFIQLSLNNWEASEVVMPRRKKIMKSLISTV